MTPAHVQVPETDAAARRIGHRLGLPKYDPRAAAR